MAKIVKVFLIFLFFLTGAVYASALSSLDKFDKNFASASNKDKIAMHQELRTLYVKSIMENNVNLRAESLKRLIKSSKTLGLDSKSYEKELAGIPQPKSASPKQESKPVKENKAKEPEQKEPVKLKQLSSAPLSSKNAQNVKTQTLYLLEAADTGGKLELKFSRPLDGGDVKKTDLNQKGSYKSIYEFKGIWSGGKPQRIKNYLVDEIRISQFDANTVRVVFIDKFKHNLKLRVQNQSVIFSKATAQNSDSLSVKTPESKSNENLKEPQKAAQKAQIESKQNEKIQPKNQQTKAEQAAKSAQNDQEIAPKPKPEEETPVSLAKTASTKKITSAKGKVIVLDAGHGGDDPGAVNGQLKEKNIVLSIAQKAGKELQG